jgi:hypothetical protein
LLEALLVSAAAGLRRYARQPDLRAPAAQRLAFRELGLAIGLAAAQRLQDEPSGSAAARAALAEAVSFVPLAAAIETFWLADEHRRNETWRTHEDINDVMLATALVPEGFLVRRC